METDRSLDGLIHEYVFEHDPHDTYNVDYDAEETPRADGVCDDVPYYVGRHHQLLVDWARRNHAQITWDFIVQPPKITVILDGDRVGTYYEQGTTCFNVDRGLAIAVLRAIGVSWVSD